jgi:carboxymethylenebutenolidase
MFFLENDTLDVNRELPSARHIFGLYGYSKFYMEKEAVMAKESSHQTSAISRDIITLYDRFTHGGMDRRAFMSGLTKLAGSTAAAAALLPLLHNNYAQAETINPYDPRLETAEGVAITGGEKGLTGYLARPKGSGKLSSVLVIHENRGLNPHIKDITRRFALEGFLALGLDELSPDGGTPEDEDKARDMFAKLTGEVAEARAASAIRFLATHPQSTGKVGAVGFCWGGGIVNRVAAGEPMLKAGIAYYGPQPPAERVASIKAALMLHYAGLDQRIDAGIPAYQAALDAAKVHYQLFIYDNVDHAFNNDTNAARYNEAAAKLAWSRSVEFLKRELV